MVCTNFNYIVAIDTLSGAEDQTEAIVSIPKKLKKQVEKNAEALGLKLLILHSPNVSPNEFFTQSTLNKWVGFIEFTDNHSDFWFKLGLGLGSKIHTVLYTNYSDSYDTSIRDKLKFLQKEETENIADPNVGFVEVNSLEELENFDYPVLKNLQTKFFETCFPERTELEQLPHFERTLEEVWKKISKHISKTDCVDVNKFVNTWSNLIKQHITSSKVVLSKSNLYKKYLLSYALDDMTSKEVISNKVLDDLLANHIYTENELSSSVNVIVDKHKLREIYNEEEERLSVLIGGTNDSINMSSSTTKTIMPNRYSCLDESTRDHSRMWEEAKDSSLLKTDTTADWTLDSLNISSNPGEQLSFLWEVGFSESECKDMLDYVYAQFIRKYEQATYENIKKPPKFFNAVSNFIDQTFESKKFRKQFATIENNDTKEQVGILIRFLIFGQPILINSCVYLFS